MKKISVFLLSVLFALHAYTQDVSVILHAPATASQGQEFELAITVNKADVTGFARLQVDLPAGFTVKAGTTQGSTFSFKDNKIRFLWMSLPADRTIKVSCMATADNSVGGAVTLEGAFSYVMNNETQRFTIPSQAIQFGAAAVVSNVNAQQEADRAEKERQDKLAKEREEHDRLAIEKAEQEAREEAERLAKEYELQKSSEVETIAEVKTTEQNLTTTPEVIETPVSTPVTEDVPVVTEPVITEPVVTEPIVAEPVVIEPVVSEPVTTYTPPSSTRKTSSGSVEYKVQVGAFKNTPAQGYFRKLENSFSEHRMAKSNDNDGFVRYFIGSFDNFNAVESFHQRVLALGYTSFIVAHKDGRKITIKEAKQLSGN